MTGSTLKLPFASQPVMTGSATLLAGQTLFDPHIPVMLFACSFIGKPLSKIQCIHVFFHAKINSHYAKLWRGVWLWLINYLIFTVLFGCKKEKQEIKFFHIPNTLKNSALFQKNSYWVYRNDTTGATDCTYVKSDLVSGSTTYKYNDNVDYVIDYVKMPIQSTLFYHFNISNFKELFFVFNFYINCLFVFGILYLFILLLIIFIFYNLIK